MAFSGLLPQRAKSHSIIEKRDLFPHSFTVTTWAVAKQMKQSLPDITVAPVFKGAKGNCGSVPSKSQRMLSTKWPCALYQKTVTQPFPWNLNEICWRHATLPTGGKGKDPNQEFPSLPSLPRRVACFPIPRHP